MNEFDSARLERMASVMRGHVDSGEVPSLVSLVSRRGETQVQAFGRRDDPVARDSIFRIASLTKPITAVAAMILVEECRLRLDDPVDEFLPELANRRVVKSLEGPLNDTVPANRSITPRDLLTLRMGLGHIMQPGCFPVYDAAHEAGLLLGPPQPQTMPDPDEWIRRVGTLPLIHQPGEVWMYDLGLDVLGVLIARVSGQPFDTFLRERVFKPLGMVDTDFWVPAEKQKQLTSTYRKDGGNFVVYDQCENSQWSKPAPFPSGSGGLVSTVDDYLAFNQMLLNKGRHGNERIISRASVELMTSDQLERGQAAAQPIFLGENRSWGFGIGVVTHRTDFPSVGTCGWTGGLGALAIFDPAEDLTIMVFTGRMMDSPQLPKVFTDVQTLAYSAIAS